MARIRVNTPYHLGLSVRRLSESAFPALSMARPIRNRYGCHTLASAGPSADFFFCGPKTTLLTRLRPVTIHGLRTWTGIYCATLMAVSGRENKVRPPTWDVVLVRR